MLLLNPHTVGDPPLPWPVPSIRALSWCEYDFEETPRPVLMNYSACSSISPWIRATSEGTPWQRLMMVAKLTMMRS